MPFEPAQIVVGAVLGFASTGALRWWQYRRDLWLARTKDLSEAVEKFSDEAANYWAEVGRRKSHERSNVKLQEARLLGMNTIIDGMWPAIGDRLNEHKAKGIEQLLNEMTIAALSGDFGEDERAPRPNLPEKLIRLGATIRVTLHEEVGAALTVKGWWLFVWQRAARWQAAAARGDAV